MSLLNEIASIYVGRYNSLGEDHYLTREALDSLCKAANPIVIGIAKSIIKNYATRSSDDIQDLIAEGMVAVVEKSKNYDEYNPDRTSYNTFIFNHVAGAMKHYMRDRYHMIRRPAKVQENDYKLRNLDIDLQDENAMADVCKKYDISYQSLKAALTVPHKATSEVPESSPRHYRRELEMDKMTDDLHVSMCLDQMQEPHKGILVLISQGYSDREIAAKLGFGITKTKNMIKHAKTLFSAEIHGNPL